MTTQDDFVLGRRNTLTRDGADIWSFGETTAFDYSDGDVHEEYLRRVLSGATDLGVDSPELQEKIADWPSEYHLSPKRANLLRAFDLSGVRNALELGCGAGSISRYLGERGIAVDAVEGSRRRAELTRLRCRDLAHVHVVNANFNDLVLPEKAYDAVFLIGVLEYAQRFLPQAGTEREAVCAVLERAQAALKDDGILVIAMENRVGLKYLLGATEDHCRKPLVGLYGYPESTGVRTYDKREWERLLAQAGANHYRFCYPFPDHKIPDLVLSDSYLRDNPYAYSHLYRMRSRDYRRLLPASIDEFSFWQAVQGAGLSEAFANSFVIIASRSVQTLDRVVCADFAHFSGLNRKARYRVLTSKPAGTDRVVKVRLVDSAPAQAGDTAMRHVLETGRYCEGDLLSTVWLRVLDTSDCDEFAALLKRYYAFLVAYAQDGDGNGAREMIDLLPWNIVVDSLGKYHAFDMEWRVPERIRPEYVLFRALVYFAYVHHASFRRMAKESNLTNIGDLVQHCFALVGLDVAPDLEEFVAREDGFQHETEHKAFDGRTRDALGMQLGEDASLPVFRPHLYWAADDEGFDEDRCVALLKPIGPERHRLVFQLPPSVRRLRRLRFDPGFAEGFFHLYRLQLRYVGNNAGSSTGVWGVSGRRAITRALHLEDVCCCERDGDEVFVSSSDDPRMTVEIPGKVEAEGDGYYVFEVEMDWPKSNDFVVAREAYIRESTALKARVQELEHEIDRRELEWSRAASVRTRVRRLVHIAGWLAVGALAQAIID